MYTLIKTFSFAVAVFALAGWPEISLGQTRRVVSEKAYERILDIVFQRTEPPPSAVRFEIVLRFLPSNHAESEIHLDVYYSGMTQALLSTVSGPSVWTTANDYIQKNGKEDAAEIAGLVRTTRLSVPLSTRQAESWQTGLLKALGQSGGRLLEESITLGRTGTVTLPLDGTIYQVWLTQGATRISWQLMDQEVSNAGPLRLSGLARWMSEVRRYAFEHALKR